MPRVRPKGSRIKPDLIYQARTSLAVDSWPTVIAQGARLRGDHPVVRSHPQFFVEDGSLPETWADQTGADEVDEGWIPPPHDLRLRDEPQPLEDAVELTRDLTVLCGVRGDPRQGGDPGTVVMLKAGQRFNAHSEIAARLPDAFRKA
jgi:hypothetical protein